MRKLVVSMLLASAAITAQPALAKKDPAPLTLPAVGAPCAITDIQFSQAPVSNPGASGFDCRGFYSGNLLNDANASLQLLALNQLGFGGTAATFHFGDFELISPLGGSQSIDFTQALNGTTYIGMHFGNGQGGPGNATAFYRFDAGTSLDKFYLYYKASSNAVLYKTGTPPPPPVVPEPATWAMMIAGFAAVGYAMRRSRRNVTVSFT